MGRGKREPDFPPSQKGGDSGSSVVELPDILPEQLKWRTREDHHHASSAPGSLNAGSNDNNNGNKKVHFAAEGLPFIKGNGIAALQQRDHAETPAPTPSTANKVTAASTPEPRGGGGGAPAADTLQPPWSAPVTSRSLATMTPRSKMFKPMPIPKIDIVSEIYDELIVKTIQTFLERFGPLAVFLFSLMNINQNTQRLKRTLFNQD